LRKVPLQPHIDLHVAIESIGECILVGKCVFCGLGFVPIRVARFSSYKHAYHDLCSIHHFGQTIKCIVKECEAKMHEVYWGCVGLTKPKTFGEFDIQMLDVDKRGVQQWKM